MTRPLAPPHRFEVAARIARERLVAIVRSDDAATASAVAEALLGAGAGVLEVSLTTPGALGVVERLAAGHPDAVIGAGTVLDAPSAAAAIGAGARLLVAPGFASGALETGHRYGAVVVPGVASPTEVERALSAGADLLKLFPAAGLGPQWLAAIREPLPQAPFVVTGGVDPGNVAAWFDAGAVAVGAGFGGGATADPAAAAERLRAIAGAVRAA
jgi:2-dehydro-3-deoxyphosphogluconate aldolase / (4S)-4-hydroxy-2-oxoglutarate aldolase